MASFNKVILIGNLCADPELKQTASGVPVTSFTIGVSRRFTSNQENAQNTDFINVVCWRKTAEFVSKYFQKGKPILVCGSLQTRTWTDQNNQKRYATDVVADEINFVDSKGESPATRGAGAQYTPESYGAPSFSSQDADAPRFEDIPNDDDLPF